MRKRSVRYKLLALLSAGLLAGAVGGSYAAFSSSASNAGNTFSAATSFVSCTGTNPSWVTGIEHGVASVSGGGLFDYLQNSNVDSSVKRSGSYSLRINSTAGANAYAGKLAGGSTLVMRFALRFASLPPGDVASLAGTYVSAGSNLQLGYRASDQKLTLSYGGVSPVASSMTISAGTWYVVELKAELGSNPRTGQWRVDSIAQPSVSSAEAAASNFIAAFGTIVSTDVFTINVDDVFVSSTSSDYPLGDGKVLGLSPNAVDSHSNPGNFRDHAGSTIGANTWTLLDDVPMDSTADGVEQRTSSGTSYLGFGFADPFESCVRAVSGVMAYRAMTGGGGANSGRTDLLDGSTERTIYNGDMSGTALQYKSAVVTPTDEQWSQNAVNALIARLGHATDVNPVPRWESLLLEYETPG